MAASSASTCTVMTQAAVCFFPCARRESRTASSQSVVDEPVGHPGKEAGCEVREDPEPGAGREPGVVRPRL